MTILGNLAARQETMQNNLETLTTAVNNSNTVVDTLAQRVQANLTAIGDLSTEQNTFILNFGGQLTRLENSVTATRNAHASGTEDSATHSHHDSTALPNTFSA